jgi:hypothetical protein
MILFSTDSSKDLSAHNNHLISFSTELPPLAEQTLLKYPNKWFVGSREGCSCGFRHLIDSSVVLGFREPEDWFPEKTEDIDATLRFVAIVKELLNQGANVDCIDTWWHSSDSASLDGTIQVDFFQLNSREFCFFENHHFIFSTKSNLSVNTD